MQLGVDPAHVLPRVQGYLRRKNRSPSLSRKAVRSSARCESTTAYCRWGRSFRLSARTAAVTSGSEQTAGRSRLTSNRRFASGRRPGWLSPREVRFSHTSANRSSRHRCRPLVAHRPTGASSCRCPPSTREVRRRPTSCPPSGDVREESATPGRQCTCPQRLWSSAREPQC